MAGSGGASGSLGPPGIGSPLYSSGSSTSSPSIVTEPSSWWRRFDGPSLDGGAVLVAALAVGAAVGLVLGLAARPVLEVLGRVALLELLHHLLGLLDLLLFLLGLWAGRRRAGVGSAAFSCSWSGAWREYPRPRRRKRKRPRGGRAAVLKRIPPQLLHERAWAQSVRPPGRCPDCRLHREPDHRTCVQIAGSERSTLGRDERLAHRLRLGRPPVRVLVLDVLLVVDGLGVDRPDVVARRR